MGHPRSYLGPVALSILNEELSAAEDGCRALQIDFFLPADGLRTSWRDYFYGRLDTASGNRGYG